MTGAVPATTVLIVDDDQAIADTLAAIFRMHGYTARVADACAIVPTVCTERITPHAEAFQAVIWHGLVSHPALARVLAKWESER